jgi:putative two-component system response regulator
VELADLDGAVKRAMHKRTLHIEQQRVERLIREEVVLRTAELEKEKEALRNLTMNIARSLINAMEAKDLYLRGHSQRVAELAASIAEELGLDADTVEHVRLAGQLHDVGKIGIRESVLNKPGKLTPEEFEHVKDHVRMSMEILAPLTHLERVLRFVHDHHEHWDAGGYPRGLAGDEISIGGRILAAADAFDAVTSRRAYREALGQEAAVDYLASHVGTLLDPAVYRALRSVVQRRRALEYLDIEGERKN